MDLSESEAWARLAGADHGVLGTIHPDRGVDLVPVVFVADAHRRLFVPVDTVKAKGSVRLRRLENVRLDDRCTLLVERYDDDWSDLWWVRLHGRGRVVEGSDVEPHRLRLAAKYPQYEPPGSVVSGLLLTASSVVGWAAS